MSTHINPSRHNENMRATSCSVNCAKYSQGVGKLLSAAHAQMSPVVQSCTSMTVNRQKHSTEAHKQGRPALEFYKILLMCMNTHEFTF